MADSSNIVNASTECCAQTALYAAATERERCLQAVVDCADRGLLTFKAADEIMAAIRTYKCATTALDDAMVAEIKRLRTMIKSYRATYAGYDAESAASKKHIDELSSALAGMAQALVSMQDEAERLRAAISFVRMRSAHACEMLNEFDNTRRALEPGS